MSVPVARFYVTEPLVPGTTVTVGEDAARHMRVRRLGLNAEIVLLDGQGLRATARVRTLAKRNASVEIEGVASEEAAADVHALVPIADRERMLWLAEKATELGVSSWRPVLWRHSRSVSPSGKGPGFQAKVLARMAGALEQSGNAWLPAVYPDATVEHALAALPAGMRILLDASAPPLTSVLERVSAAPVIVALGPEGGFDDDEREVLAGASFLPASLGPNTLRFETAGIVAIAHVRAALHSLESDS